jgi:tetratricopeptide (TPR) repeat protein
VLWVNSHGVSVLGPVLVGWYALDKAAAWLWARRRGGPAPAAPPREWKHLAGVLALVFLACLVNPYFLDGALYPLLLLPKTTVEGNLYKQHIAELHSPRDFALGRPGSLGDVDACTRALVFLLLVVPVSFALPAVWESWREAPRRARKGPGGAGDDGHPGAWRGALGVAVALSVVATAALPGRATARWLAGAEFAVPVCFVLLGAAGAWALRGRSAVAALLALLGGVSGAAWVVWLRDHLLDGGATGLSLPLLAAAAAGAPAAVRVAARPGGLFRLLLAGAFAYLALQAVRNGSLFALAGGAVCAWNLGEWLTRLGAPAGRGPWALRLGAVALLGAWVWALASDRYFPWAGEAQRLGLGEQPFAFAHDAARFAGRPGMPDRAFVSDIRQAAVYVFHNGPDGQPFMDPRLEFPRTETFARYLDVERWLQQQDPRGTRALHEMGDPLVLIFHAFRRNTASAAGLLADPDWRCVRFDAVASVFVPRAAAAAAGPEVDFAARLFRPAQSPVVPDHPGAARREALALCGVARALPASPAGQSWRTAVLLGALGRAGLGVGEDDSSAEAWDVLGDCHRLLAPRPPPALADPWDPARVVPWAQATYCYRRALDRAPDDDTTLVLLYNAYWERGLADAWLGVAERLEELGAATAEQRERLPKVRSLCADLARRVPAREQSPAEGVTSRLDAQLPEAAVRRAEEAEGTHPVAWPWPVADHLATAYLHLGRPGDARRVWERSTPPSRADLLCRLAATRWVERDPGAAAALYRQALDLDPGRAEAWWGLAWVSTQQGQARPALEAGRAGLEHQPTPQQRAGLRTLFEVLPRYAPPRADGPDPHPGRRGPPP